MDVKGCVSGKRLICAKSIKKKTAQGSVAESEIFTLRENVFN